jgi:hypothetical protein
LALYVDFLGYPVAREVGVWGIAVVVAIVIALTVDFGRGSRASIVVSRVSSSTRIALEALIMSVPEL